MDQVQAVLVLLDDSLVSCEKKADKENPFQGRYAMAASVLRDLRVKITELQQTE